MSKSSINEVSSIPAAGDDQPNGAWLPKGKTRVLGRNDGINKTDKWYINGGYTQVDFPTADAIFGDDDADSISVKYSHDNVPRMHKKLETDFEKAKRKEKIEIKERSDVYDSYSKKILDMLKQ
jgi:hypothetical protein